MQIKGCARISILGQSGRWRGNGRIRFFGIMGGHYAIACTECSHRTPRRLAWLITQDTMRCEQCGEIIDLREGENAIVIEELAVAIIDEKVATRVEYRRAFVIGMRKKRPASAAATRAFRHRHGARRSAL